MSIATNVTFRFVLVSISISSLLLLFVDGFTLFAPYQKNQQRHGNSLIIRSMVATNPLPSTSSSFTDDENDYDYDEIDNENDEIDDLSSTTMIQKQKQISQQPIRRYQSSKKEPLIAILGRPNVGKSALVNRIAGTQNGGAIVADEAGITRDRTYREANFLGENFQVVDTGGLVFDDVDTLFAKEIREQAMVAIDESSGVILVVDGQIGMTAMDLSIAEFLRKDVLSKNLPVVLAVNKCESETVGALNAAEFWNLGLGEPFPVSALHGVGTADVLEKLFEEIKEKQSAALPDFGTKVKRLKEAKLRKKSKKTTTG